MVNTKSSTKHKDKCNSCQEIGKFPSESTFNNLIWVNEEKADSHMWKPNPRDSEYDSLGPTANCSDGHTATTRKHKPGVRKSCNVDKTS